MNLTLCTEFKDVVKELCLPECASFGVIVQCEKCKFSWNKSDREWWWSKIVQAQKQLEIDIGVPLCPTEYCREVVYLDKCPTFLKHRPIAYLGKKVLVEKRVQEMCYAELSDCGAEMPVSMSPACSEENDLIGTVMVTEIPEGVTVDNIEFCYAEALCFNTNQILALPECINVIECEGEVVGVEAIWSKCQLIHPNCNTAKLSQEECFLTEIDVKFNIIDESLAIEIPQKCTCGACDPLCPSTGFTITTGDALKGEVCIVADGCSCIDKYVYVNYASNHKCVTDDTNIVHIISLLALILAGNKRFCDCAKSNDYIDTMLEIDPSVTRENASPLEGTAVFPYGKTRAGIELKRIVENVRQELIQDGTIQTDRGGFIGGMPREHMVFRGGRRW